MRCGSRSTAAVMRSERPGRQFRAASPSPVRFCCIMVITNTLRTALAVQAASTKQSAAFPVRPLTASAAVTPHAGVVLDKYFPQFRNRCGNDKWKLDYAALHHEIVSGKKPPYYLTSVAVEKGLADRMAGLVTQFYVALLSRRAFTMMTYGGLPAFEAVCDMPYINWTQPFTYPNDAVKLVKNRFPHDNPNSEKVHINLTYPDSGPVNSSTYYPLYFLDQNPWLPQNWQLHQLARSNLTLYPAGQHKLPYVLAAGNRGQSYVMMKNPYHKQQFWSYGLTPDTAFMCGFFYLCAPNTAVSNSKAEFWDKLSKPGTLRIGISVRIGDWELRIPHSKKLSAVIERGSELLETKAAGYFKCAERIERMFAVPGQQVIWYLMSDSMALRQAAKQKYGSKILTDVRTQVMHTADARCTGGGGGYGSTPCSNKTSLEAAMQHALGEMLTFSMTDYQVYGKYSGFGRLGAWLSARYNSIYEVTGPEGCMPGMPTPLERSSQTSAHVRKQLL